MSVNVQQLSKIYAQQTAVGAISFEVKKGEILGFLGPNGAGKSTTMKMLACYIPPTSGTATVCGYDIINETEIVKRKTGYLPENNPLYTDMYTREFLEFVLEVHGLKHASQRKKRIDDVIGMVGLGIEQQKKIGQLSKGYRQRVGLAQALIHDPEILILDEPTSGLDPNQLADIRNLIKELGKEKTILFSTHIMQEVQAVCDRVIIINKGKLVADDRPDNLQKLFNNEAVIEIEFEHPVAEEELLLLPTIVRLERLSGKQFVLHGNDSNQLRKDIFAFAASKNNPLLKINAATKSMEDIFQQLTNG